MELVKGVPITKYCDEHHLTPRQRLELFIPVCQAIQHAHQKGIIHRDIKPSNVLVAMYDDRPVPKVIDFGVAKATGVQLTEATLHTDFGAVVGTIEYMSPEQAGFNQLDVDTRSDIYSLGVLLYELLAGSPPFTRKELEKAGMMEMLRVIREQEPSKPSTKLSSSDALPTLSAHRGTEPARLAKLVRGELDWIVLKALEKDRNQRYETANDFALDLQRYLADEPVQASPPSAGYRLRKFTRRNKGAVLALTAIVLLLIIGITGTTWGLVRAENARLDEARQRQVAVAAATAETEQRHRAENALATAAREAAIAAAINDFLNKDLLQLSTPLGQVHQGLTPDANLKLRTVLQRAATQIDGKFVEEPEIQMRIRETIGTALDQVGDYKGALAQFEKVAPYYRDTFGPDHEKTLLMELRLASMHRRLAHHDIAQQLLEQNMEKQRAALGPAHAQTILSMHELALAYGAAGRKEKALPLAEEMLELQKRQFGPTHHNTLVAMHNVALLFQQHKQLDKAVPLFEESLAGMRTKLAPLHPERLNTTTALARAYYLAEQIDKAAALHEGVLPQFKAAYGADDIKTLQIFDSLVGWYVDLGWCDKAEALLTPFQSGGAKRLAGANPALDPREKRHRDLIRRMKPAADKYQSELAQKNADHPDTLAARQAFAVALRNQSRRSAAAFHLTAVLNARQRLLPADHPDLLVCQLELGAIRLQQGKFTDADSLLRDFRTARSKHAPADWTTFYAESLQGAALQGLKDYANAEPLLLDGYEGLKQHESQIPAQAKSTLADALRRLVQLYDGWDKKDKADEWRRKLEEQKK
jgi:hypothetical protein